MEQSILRELTAMLRDAEGGTLINNGESTDLFLPENETLRTALTRKCVLELHYLLPTQE